MLRQEFARGFRPDAAWGLVVASKAFVEHPGIRLFSYDFDFRDIADIFFLCIKKRSAARRSKTHEMNEPAFTQSMKVLAMTCRVNANILATAEIVWGLLTDAKGFPRWNSTVTGIDGEIREGERLRLHVPGSGRTFTPEVSGVVAGRGMTWSDGITGVFKGVRTFGLMPRSDNSTDFVMEERFSGVMFALTRWMLPDFRPIFEAYAGDLKREAERIARENAGGSRTR
jgi:hypothetical protein